MSWEALHDQVEPGRGFRDTQVRGPFASWAHEHRFVDAATGGSVLIDDVRYRLPFGSLGHVIGGKQARAELDALFRYRHDVTRGDLALHARFAARPRMRVAIAGANGLIGHTLAAVLTTGGHEVVRLVRDPRPIPSDDSTRVPWRPATGEVDPRTLGSLDALVYLAGEPIVRRWSRRRRRRILDSRAGALERLARGLEQAGARPRIVVAVSGVGYYGPTARRAREQDGLGRGFLASVAIAAEDALEQAARRFDARSVALRMGVVLDPRGGYLGEVLRSARLGLGAIIGRGHRRVPWVSLEDAVDAIVYGLLDDEIDGPINVVAPESASQAAIARTLGRLLRRPVPVRLPPQAFDVILGRSARETVLIDLEAFPDALVTRGFDHRWPTLESALAHVLGRSPA